MPKSLKETCVFVKGAKNAAIYDLANSNVYALNNIGKQIVESFIARPDKLDSKGVKYIEKLETLGLVEETDTVRNFRKQIDIPDCRLRFAWLELTTKCNLKCIHCYGQFGSSVNNYTNASVMSIGDWKSVIYNLKLIGCTSIQLIGGEPLCFEGWQEIIVYAKEIGMDDICVFTNGTLVNENFIQLVKKVGADIRISLYGHNADIHDSVTKVAGSFEKTQKALNLLAEHNIPTIVSVIVMKANQAYITEIENYISSLGHKFKGYDTIRKVAECVSGENCVTDVDILKKRYITSPDFSITEQQYIRNLRWNPCWSGKIAITSSGDVFPCIFARNSLIGNIQDENIDAILDAASPFWSMTLDQVDGCKDCEFRYACHDCRPLAQAIAGDFASKQPRCCYDPYEGAWLDISNCTKELFIS